MPFELLRYLTPHKLGRPVLAASGVAGAFDRNAVDGCFVFWHNGQFYMMYCGFDGQGYQTALATSTDLLHWLPQGVILGRGAGNGWDERNCAGSCMLKQDNELFATPTLKKMNGKYWLLYHSYPQSGYETGPAEIGLAWCEDETLAHWHRLPRPVFSWRQGGAWERGGLYKCCLVEHEGLFHLFYNAKDERANWDEQTGLATSRDLVHWQRCGQNPLLRVSKKGWDSRFCSDAQVLYDSARGLWLMYYFGYNGHHAQEGLAYSEDLLAWHKHPQPILAHGAPGQLDSLHAHKPCVVWHNGVLYHFYCACRPAIPTDSAVNGGVEFRCLTVAASAPFAAQAGTGTNPQNGATLCRQ